LRVPLHAGPREPGGSLPVGSPETRLGWLCMERSTLVHGGQMTGPLTNASNLNLGLVLAVLASILWGLTYCLDERVLSSMSVFQLYFLHCLCGVAVAGAILLIRGASPAALFTIDTSKAGLPLIALTLITATAAALSILGSIQLLGANKSAVMEISYPLFVALFSVLLFKGQLQLPVVLGGIFIFIGSAIIVLAD